MEGVRVEIKAGGGRGHSAVEESDIASLSSASQWISPEVTQVASPGCLRPSGKRPQSGDTSRLFPFTGTFPLPPPLAGLSRESPRV